MGNLVRGISATSIVSWPASVKTKMISPDASNLNLAYVPDLNSADGSVWKFTTAGVTRISATGATIFTVAAADVNAAATTLLGFSIDYTDAKIYMIWAGATPNAPWFATNPLTSKLVASVALTTTFTTGVLTVFLDRPGGQGTGNLRIYNLNTAHEYRDISTTGVLQGTTTAIAFGGVNLPLLQTAGFANSYFTAAGTVYCNVMTDLQGATNGLNQFRVARNGSYGVFSSARTSNPFLSGLPINAIINGSSVTLFGTDTLANSPTPIPRTFARSDWDVFLNAVADSAGCL